MESGMGKCGRRGMREWWPLIMIVAVLLACGAPSPFKPLPAATLPPGVAPFEVVTLGAGALQNRAGRDGTLLWQQAVETASDSVLVEVGGLIYHRAQGGGAVEAFSAATGVQVWRLSDCPGYDDALAATDGLLFVTCGLDAPASPNTIANDMLYALDAATGIARWHVQGERFRAVVGDLVITQTPSGLAARTVARGDVRWSRPLLLAPQVLADPGHPESSSFDIAIVGVAGMLYLSPDGLHVVALHAVDGRMRWKSVSLVNIFPGASPIQTPPYVVAAATAHTIIARAGSGHSIIALDSGTGMVRWHIADATPGSGLTSLVGADGAIFVNSFAQPTAPWQTIRRLNTETGAPIWSVPGPVLRNPPLWYAAGALYVGDGPRLFALRADDGVRLFDDQGLYPAELAANSDVVCVDDSHDLFLLSARDGKRIWEAKSVGDLRAAPIIITMSA
jgi:outer membrane protein assembly factor BamB